MNPELTKIKGHMKNLLSCNSFNMTLDEANCLFDNIEKVFVEQEKKHNGVL